MASSVTFQLSSRISLTVHVLEAGDWFRRVSEFGPVVSLLEQCGRCDCRYVVPRVRREVSGDVYEIACPACQSVYPLRMETKNGALEVLPDAAWSEPSAAVPKTVPPAAGVAPPKAEGPAPRPAAAPGTSKRDELKQVLRELVGCDQTADYEAVVWWATAGRVKAQQCSNEITAGEVLCELDRRAAVGGIPYAEMLRTSTEHLEACARNQT